MSGGGLGTKGFGTRLDNKFPTIPPWYIPIKSEEINQREVQSDMEAPAAACVNCKASVADYKLICILGGLQLIITKLPHYSDSRSLVGVPNISPKAPNLSIFLIFATSETLSTGKFTSLFCLKLHDHIKTFICETQKVLKTKEIQIFYKLLDLNQCFQKYY